MNTETQDTMIESVPNVERAHCVIAVDAALNAWGRGETVRDALRQLVKAGGNRGRAQLRFILGDAKAYISGMGDLMMVRGALSYTI